MPGRNLVAAHVISSAAGEGRAQKSSWRALSLSEEKVRWSMTHCLLPTTLYLMASMIRILSDECGVQLSTSTKDSAGKMRWQRVAPEELCSRHDVR